MDDFDDLQPSEFITDTDDQDSLDERIDTEQRLRNQQLWASFQNAACCITKLYKDRTQPNISPWVPFQNAASNLTTLYRDCIESQRRFAKIGYQVGRRRRLRDIKKWIKKHQSQVKQQNTSTIVNVGTSGHANFACNSSERGHNSGHQQQSTVASILDVNQLNLDCDGLSPSRSMQDQTSSHEQAQQQQQQQQPQPHIQLSSTEHHHHNQLSQQYNMQTNFQSNTEDDLVTFQQALAQPAIKVRPNQNRRQCLNSSHGYLNSRTVDQPKSEEDRLLELNQFLSEEYHRHVGSRKRSCSALGGPHMIKKFRE